MSKYLLKTEENLSESMPFDALYLITSMKLSVSDSLISGKKKKSCSGGNPSEVMHPVWDPQY